MLNCHLSPLHAHHHQTRVLTAMPCEAVEECTFSVHLHMIDCSHSATIVRGTIPCVIMAQQYKIRIAMKLVACPVNWYQLNHTLQGQNYILDIQRWPIQLWTMTKSSSGASSWKICNAGKIRTTRSRVERIITCKRSQTIACYHGWHFLIIEDRSLGRHLMEYQNWVPAEYIVCRQGFPQ